MKKIVAIVFNDVHLKSGNEHIVTKSLNHLLEFAKQNGVKNLILAGDLFHSRKQQRLSVLKTFERFLDKAHAEGIYIDGIPGNHDRQDYMSYDSFLDSYKHFPSFNLIRDVTKREINGVNFTFIPFFDDNILIPKLDEAEGGDVLISHFEMAGSTHLGKVCEKTSINRKLLNKWNKVYLGHYHNTHEITKNIIHLPSLFQDNFGEDGNKGFSVIYDDLTYDIIQGDFQRFKKVSVDVNTITPKELEKLIKTHKNSEDKIRFELIGSKAKIKALDKSKLSEAGIDYKTTFEEEVIKSNETKPEVIKKYNKDQVDISLKDFCKSKSLDYGTGKKYLSEFIEKKEG